MHLSRKPAKKQPSRRYQQFVWTFHARDKMNQYGLSDSRVVRVIRHPKRIEEGIAPDTTAVMQPATPKHTSEIWAMYQLSTDDNKIKVITAWRYPGVSPIGSEIPLPPEIREVLGF